MQSRLIILSAVFSLFMIAPAQAHLLPGEHGSLAAGFTHPLFGLDHILVMVAVGLWAFRIGGPAKWAVPGSFVAMMGLGFAFALFGGALPFVEPVILASVVALGLLIAFAVQLPTVLSVVVVGGFAVFHGFAHGAEIGDAGAAAYATGFALATVALHAAGIGLGIGIAKVRNHGDGLARAMGAGTAVAGLALFLV
ncbi:MAG: HupE/UreJ family protein [Rhodospirillales bacterium]